MIYYIKRLLIIIILILPFYLLIRRPVRRGGKREIALAAFFLFMAGLLVLTLEGTYSSPADMFLNASRRIRTGEMINPIPFQTIRVCIENFEWDKFLINIVGNIVMFLPWGFGLALLWKKNQSLKRSMFFSFLLPAFIESFQLFINRHVDVDDLILNFLGGVTGAVLYFAMRKKFPALKEFAE